MLTIKKFFALIAAAAAFTAASSASAQVMFPGGGMPMPMFACATPTGIHPMPNAIPEQGRPCGNGMDNGVTVVMGTPQGGMGGPFGPGPMGGMNGPFRGDPNSPMGGGAPSQPNMPQGIPNGFGLNHEGQVTAACVASYGVSYATAGCVAGQLTADELQKCFSDGVGGRGCFGDNNTLVSMIRGNFEAARRESGTVNQTIRATTGISVKDIQDHGILGGNNSFFHCPFGGC